MDLFKKIKNKIFNKNMARNNLTVLEDDIFVVSYPRSGNTWIRFLIGTLYKDKKVDWSNLEDIVPDIYRNTDEELLKVDSPRLLKSHHSYDERYKKVLYIVRDVRDVVISYYNFKLKMDENYNESFDSFFRAFINGEIDDFGTWGQNVNSWINNKDNIENGFLMVKYEELLENTFDKIVDILNFLNLDCDYKEIESAIDWASFENMKRLEKKQQNHVELFKGSNKNINFVRKGKSGGWREELSDEHIKIIKEHFGDLLIELEYEDSLKW